MGNVYNDLHSAYFPNINIMIPFALVAITSKGIKAARYLNAAVVRPANSRSVNHFNLYDG